MTAPQPEYSRFKADSLADVFNATHTWAEILIPHGWTLVKGDGDGARSRWASPPRPGLIGGADYYDAVIRTCHLHVYSRSIGLEVGGVSKFRAYTILNHGGDDHAAAIAIVTSNGRQG